MDRSGNVGFSGSYPRNSSSGGGGINHDTFGPNYYGVGGTSRPQAFDNVDTTTDGQCFRWCGDQCPGRCTIEYMVFGQSFTAQCNFTPVRYVITSYSIHYTKLYEFCYLFGGVQKVTGRMCLLIFEY